MPAKRKSDSGGKPKDLRPRTVSSAKAGKTKGGATGRRVEKPIFVVTPVGSTGK